jgi:hypothetical protein
MNTTSLDDLLAAQTAAENAYYQAGSPRSGPIFDAYTAALNAVDRLQTQIENTNYNTPGVQYLPTPPIVDPETGRITGAVPQPGGLTAVPLVNADTPAPVNPATDPQAGSGEVVATPLTEFQLAGNTDGYGSLNETEVPASEVRFSAAQLDAAAARNNVDAGNTDIEVGINRRTVVCGRSRSTRARRSFFTGNTNSKSRNQHVSNTTNSTQYRLASNIATGTWCHVSIRCARCWLLQPLKVPTVLYFPTLHIISTAYKANYSDYNLTHSNYRGYFYQNSYTDAINFNATFTAQSTSLMQPMCWQ